MTRKHLRLALFAIYVLAIALRYEAFRAQEALHPDEFFQYIEPAFQRLTGAGMQAWEFRDGVRSWVLPGFNGTLMVAFATFGLPSVWHGQALQAVWGLLSLTLIFAGYRGASAIARRLAPHRADRGPDKAEVGWEGGLLGALLCAAFPWIVTISVHTLSELPAMLCITLALALCVDMLDRRQHEALQLSGWVGTLIAAGVLFRISYLPCIAMPVLAILASRRFGLLAPLAFGMLVPLLVFGEIDWLTWGAPFESFVQYVKFNMLDGGAEFFGVEPPGYYVDALRSRLPLGLWALMALCVIGLRVGWVLSLPAFGLTALLSSQLHKEERFVVLFWPLVLIAAAGSAGAMLISLGSQRVHRRRMLTVSALAIAGLVEAHAHGAITTDRYHVDECMSAQGWLGRQSDVSGILSFNPCAGQAWLGNALPLILFNSTLLDNPLFSHAIVLAGSSYEAQAREAGFSPVYRPGKVAVLARYEP